MQHKRRKSSKIIALLNKIKDQSKQKELVELGVVKEERIKFKQYIKYMEVKQ